MKEILIVTVLCLPFTGFAQDSLQELLSRDTGPGVHSPDHTYGSEVVGDEAESPADRTKRIRDTFGEGASAVELIEETESRRKELSGSTVRENLTEAEHLLQAIKSTNLNGLKRKQLAMSWNRLAFAERALFGDSPKEFEWLLRANDLDPDNEDIARALDRAERKREKALAQIEEATAIRAARANNQ